MASPPHFPEGDEVDAEAESPPSGTKRRHSSDEDNDEDTEDVQSTTNKRARLAQMAEADASQSQTVANDSQPNAGDEGEEGEYVVDEPLPERPMAPAYHTHVEAPSTAAGYSFSPTGAEDEEGELAEPTTTTTTTRKGAEAEGGGGVSAEFEGPTALRPKEDRVEGPRDTLKKSFKGLSPFEDYEPSVKLGEGTFGMVIKAKHKKTGDDVALKLIRMDDMEKNGFPITALREIQLLKMLKHENVLGMREIVIRHDPSGNRRLNKVYMSFDFFPHDLAGLLERHEPGYFGLPVYKMWAKQLLEGMFYLHRVG